MYKKDGAFGYATCKDMADAIAANIDLSEGTIEKVTLSMMGGGKGPADPAKAMWFLNLHMNPQFIQDRIAFIFKATKIKMLDLA